MLNILYLKIFIKALIVPYILITLFLFLVEFREVYFKVITLPE